MHFPRDTVPNPNVLTPNEQHGLIWLVGALLFAVATVIWYGVRWALHDRARAIGAIQQMELRVQALEQRVGVDGDDGIRGELASIRHAMEALEQSSGKNYEELLARLNRWNNDLQLKFSLLSGHSGGPLP